VHWAHTGPRMNVQDFVDGLPGEDLAAVDAAGLDRKVLARRGAHAVLKMIVEDGFFHADPHPGNVFYLPGNRLAFIDFGMVGRLSPRRREELLNLLLGLVQRDPPAVAEVLLDWAGDTRGVDIAQLESAIEEFVDQYHGTPLAQLNLGQMLTEVTDVLRAQSLALPGDLALLIKAFVSLESMGRGLDPDFHVAQEALPLLQRVLRGRYKPAVLGKRAWHAALKLAATAEKLPHDISRLLRRARHGQMRIGLELAHLQRVGNQLDRAATRLSMAILIAALIIGSSIVMTVGGGPTLFGLPAFGFLGFIGAFGGAIWLVRSIRSEERHDD
ncbi:MAG: phosphotransferase, partial [Burkholderiaceae bacterium]|nr:phosphotransferase [Burkholderiaceae bacterium]